MLTFVFMVLVSLLLGCQAGVTQQRPKVATVNARQRIAS